MGRRSGPGYEVRAFRYEKKDVKETGREWDRGGGKRRRVDEVGRRKKGKMTIKVRRKGRRREGDGEERGRREE